MFNCQRIKNFQNPYQIARQKLRDDFDERVKAAKSKPVTPAPCTKTRATETEKTKTKVLKYALRTFLIISSLGIVGLCGIVAFKYKRLLREASGPFQIECMGRPILVNKIFKTSEILDNIGYAKKISDLDGTYEYEGDIYTVSGKTLCQGQGDFMDTHAVTRRHGRFFNGVITEGEYHTAALVIKGKFFDGRLHGLVEGTWHNGRTFKGGYVHDLRHGSFEEKDAKGIYYCDYDKGIRLKCDKVS